MTLSIERLDARNLACGIDGLPADFEGIAVNEGDSPVDITDKLVNENYSLLDNDADDDDLFVVRDGVATFNPPAFDGLAAWEVGNSFHGQSSYQITNGECTFTKPLFYLVQYVDDELEPVEYDITGDRQVDIEDVDTYFRAFQHGSVTEDDLDGVLNAVGAANSCDITTDGHFNSSDLTRALSTGNYETNFETKWSEGDFNGDARQSSADLVYAMGFCNYTA